MHGFEYAFLQAIVVLAATALVAVLLGILIGRVLGRRAAVKAQAQAEPAAQQSWANTPALVSSGAGSPSGTPPDDPRTDSMWLPRPPVVDPSGAEPGPYWSVPQPPDPAPQTVVESPGEPGIPLGEPTPVSGADLAAQIEVEPETPSGTEAPDGAEAVPVESTSVAGPTQAEELIEAGLVEAPLVAETSASDSQPVGEAAEDSTPTVEVPAEPAETSPAAPETGAAAPPDEVAASDDRASDDLPDRPERPESPAPTAAEDQPPDDSPAVNRPAAPAKPFPAASDPARPRVPARQAISQSPRPGRVAATEQPAQARPAFPGSEVVRMRQALDRAEIDLARLETAAVLAWDRTVPALESRIDELNAQNETLVRQLLATEAQLEIEQDRNQRLREVARQVVDDPDDYPVGDHA